MATVAVARLAMATRFEILLHGADPVALRAAAEEALDEIERLETQLSLYRPTSAISQLNAWAATRPVRVEPRLFALLQRARRLTLDTRGAFDITVAPLMRCWGFMTGAGQLPDPEQLAAARQSVGMQWVELNPADATVQFLRAGVMLDLGAIGKGYAVECAAQILREAGITSAFLHGGTSTAYALGSPPDAPVWKVAVEPPETGPLRPWRLDSGPPLPGQDANRPLDSRHPLQPEPSLAIIPLQDEALSVSAIRGKAFEANGRVYGHIIDPRSGAPAEGALLAAVVLPSATETDALSTALLTVGCAGHDQIARLRPGMRALVAARGGGGAGLEIRAHGIDVLPA